MQRKGAETIVRSVMKHRSYLDFVQDKLQAINPIDPALGPARLAELATPQYHEYGTTVTVTAQAMPDVRATSTIVSAFATCVTDHATQRPVQIAENST